MSAQQLLVWAGLRQKEWAPPQPPPDLTGPQAGPMRDRWEAVVRRGSRLN
jgi:hypothetical protein